jgi:hypothetical protein
VLSTEATKSRSAGASGAGAKLSELSRHALFITRDASTYQRIVRVSPPFPGTNQLGAVATGLADHQIGLFDVSSTGAPKARGRIELPKEAADLDVYPTGPDSFQLAYCNAFELWLAKLGRQGTAVEPELVYTVPHDESSGATSRPELRAIRQLTPGFVLAISNLPKAAGVVLQAIRLPSPKNDKARLAVSERLPKSVHKATALTVRSLSPPETPGAKTGDVQYTIAIASHDGSILLYTLEHNSVQTIDVLVHLTLVRVLKDVHPLAITGLALSPFAPPAKATSRVQVIKLASISVSNTVAVHTIPLRKFIDRSVPLRKGGPPRPVRYVVATKTSRFAITPLVFVLTVIVLIMAIVGQVFLEMYGHSRPVLHAHKFLPSWHGTLRSPAGLSNEFLAGLVGDVKAQPGDRIVLREEAVTPADGEKSASAPAGQIQADVHDEEVHGPAKVWEELPPKQREAWKRRLKSAGHWAEGMGDSVFKGILFGELAGAVGRAVAG